MTTRTDNLVTSWKLDVSDIEKNTSSMSKKMNKGMADLRAGFDMAVGAVRSLGRAWDALATQGAQLERLQRNNTLSVRAATVATKGYVTQIELLKSANMAAAFNLGFTDKQFAKVARSAVIMSQKLGTDATTAINDLIVGLSRQSKKILDNLGIMVSVKDANTAYAKELGIVGRKLTDTEQKQAFMNATMKELDRLTGDASLSVANAGDQYEIMKNKISDSTAELGQAIIKTRAFKDTIEGVSAVLSDITVGFKLATGQLHLWDKGVTSALRRMSMIIPGGKAFRDVLDLSAQMRNESARRKAEVLSKQQWTFDTLFGGAGTAGGGGGGGGGGGRRGRRVRRGQISATPRAIEPVMSVGGALASWDKDVAASRKRVSEITRTADLKRQAIAEEKAARAAKYHREEIERINQPIQDANFAMIDFAQNGLAQMTAGLWTAADAAVMGTETFAMAMAKMLKSTLLSIATQATVKGMFQMAEYVASWGMNVKALQAAGMYFATAAVAGAAGLGVSAGISSAGGYSSASSSDKSSKGGYTPGFSGTKRSRDKEQPTIVTVYLGDPGDPSAALMMTKSFKAMAA